MNSIFWTKLMKKYAIGNISCIILGIFCCLGLMILCCASSQTKEIKLNVANEYKEITIKNKSRKNVYRLYCKITGKIEGVLEIEFLVDDGTTRKITSENGNINFVYNADWYTNNFTIKIIPKNNPNGEIKIVYKFSTL